MAKNKKAIKSLAVAALATSALVPVASASAATTYSDVVVSVNGELVSISQAQYNLASGLGKTPKVEYVKVDNKFYSIAEYNLKVATVGNAQAFEELTKTGKVENITPSVGAVDGSGNITNNAPVPGEFKVESISAINGTQVEVTFDKAPTTAPKAADFTIEGLEVLSVNAKSGSTTTFVVTTTAQTAGQAYTLKFGEQSKQFTAIQQVATLQAGSATYAGQFGKEVTVEYTVLDQQGKPVAGQEVYVRAGSDTSSLVKPVEKTLTSDAEGKVKFTYSRTDVVSTDGIEPIVAYVVNSPLVRNSNVNVQWTVADIAQLNVVASKAGKLGHNTIVEYTIDAKDKNGVALATSKSIDLHLGYLNNTESNLATTNANSNASGLDGIKIERQLANGTWEEITRTEYTAVGSYTTGAKIKLSEPGKAKIRVIYTAKDVKNPIEVTPIFSYSEAGRTHSQLTAEDSIFIAPSLNFVKQTPVLTLEEVKTGNVISANGTKEYKLTAKDQFGNPFRGVVTLDALENADGLATTDTVSGYTIKVDTDGDTVYELPTTAATTKQLIDFTVGKDDKVNEDGQAIIQVATGGASKELTLVAFVDEDGNKYVGDKEAKAVAAKVTFGQAAPSKINLKAQATEVTPTAASGKIKFDLELLDSEGKAFKPETELVLQLVKLDADGKETATVVPSAAYTILGDNTTAKPVTNVATTNPAIGYKVAAAALIHDAYTVELDTEKVAFADGESYKLYAYANSNTDETRQLDEVSASATFKVKSAILSKGKLTLETTAFNTFAKDSKYGAAIDVAKVTSGDTAKFKYELQDQSGAPIAGSTVAGGSTTVTWTVTNTTKKDATVTLPNGTTKTVKAGRTESFAAVTTSGDTAIVDNNTEIQISVPDTTSDSTGTIKVSAQAGSVTTSVAELSTYVAPTAAIVNNVTSTSAYTYTGTVSAFNVDGDQDKDKDSDDIYGDANFFVLSTGSVGDILFDGKTITPGKISYVVGGNTATEEAFEKALKLGSTVNVKAVDGGVVITLQ